MSPKLPVVSGEQLIGVLRKFGYEISRQKGSHVRLPVTVPLHKELAPRTLKSILSDACVNVDELRAAL